MNWPVIILLVKFFGGMILLVVIGWIIGDLLKLDDFNKE